MSQHSDQPATSHRRGRIVLAVVVVVALPVGWATLWAAPAARGDVRVEPRWFQCDGTSMPYTIMNSGDEIFDPQPAFRVPLANYTRCQMQVTVINDGSHGVHIGNLTFPMLAPGDSSGFPLELTENGGQFTPSFDEQDATVDVNEDLDGGSSIEVLVDLRPRPDSPYTAYETGREGSSGIATTQAIPRVAVSHLGVPGTISGEVAIAVVTGP